MNVIGLTGGIGSGKTTVSDWFANKGIFIADADTVAHDLLKKGSPLLQSLTKTFGAWVLDKDNHYDRHAMHRFVFDNPQALVQLNAIVHPAVFDACNDLIDNAVGDVILSVPLLVESRHKSPSLFGLCHNIWVVDIPEPLQQMRVCQRSNLSPEDAQKIINSQATRKERLSFADEIIDNSLDLPYLYAQLQRLYAKYFGK